MTSIHILAISGSLRARSSNGTLLLACARLAPAHVSMTKFEGLADLPYFNADLDQPGLELPAAVTAFRLQVERAHALLISSPEYAHGVPGVLKNALDWLVGGNEIVRKPVGLLNASPRATHAQASLREILTTMSAHVVPEASASVPLLGREIDVESLVADARLSAPVRSAMDALTRAAERSIGAP